MHKATTLLLAGILLLAGNVAAQTTEFVLDPLRTGALTDAFPVYSHNGARGLSGPFDMDHDGKLEILVAQHDAAGGTVHVIENAGLNTWELVYSTALIDSSSSSRNARYAYSGDLDNDGRGEIIFAAGNGYNTTTNPGYVIGLYVFEWDGVPGSDNYGTAPATVGDFYAADGKAQPTGSAYLDAQNFRVGDVDGDGRDEVLLPANGWSAWDVNYVLSVSGNFETNGAGTGFETWVIEARSGPRENGNAMGGGSPYGVQFGDFNGDGFNDISWHTWNYFNLYNATTDGTDRYVWASNGDNVRPSYPSDHVSLFGGTVGDINGDGTDEVFYPNWYTGKITVLDFQKFENVLTFDDRNYSHNAIPIGSSGGAAFGDVDDDGAMEILVGGPGYSLANLEAGAASHFIHIAEFNGGDPKDGANYTIFEVDTSSDLDTLGFHLIFRDSLGTTSSYHELAQSKQGSTKTGSDPIFPSGIAFIGDSDNDGDMEVAVSFQGVDDSLYVYDEVWNADSLWYDRTIRTRMANPIRPFVRIISMAGMAVSTEENNLILPSDYVLEQNYPNPFNPSTTIRFTLPIDKAVSVRIFDVTGRVVKTLLQSQHMNRGTHEISWDGSTEAGVQAASGTYLYSLEYGNFRQTKTMVLLK